MKNSNEHGLQLAADITRLFPRRLNVKFEYAYGANAVAAKYCGFNAIPFHIMGEWQHGNVIPERNLHPEAVISSVGKSNRQSHYFVAREDQEAYLRRHGYTATAIGLPIIYVAKPKVERIKKSLLVMPLHGLVGTAEVPNAKNYVDYIYSISRDFDCIVCCLNRSCFDKGNYIDEFNKIGVPSVVGGDHDDANSLERLAYMFSKFEYVTSNGFGSHMSYSAYFGAKSSISGPLSYVLPENVRNLTYYTNFPEALEILEDFNKSRMVEKNYNFLFVEPRLAVEHIEWAEFQLGQTYIKTPAELRKLFRWTSAGLFVSASRRLMLYGLGHVKAVLNNLRTM